MNTRFSALPHAAVLFVLLVLTLAPSTGSGFPDDKQAAAAPTTEDVIYMSDGRELHGQILSETKLLVVFEYTDPNLKLKTKMTVMKDDVAHIDRDVAITTESKPATATPKPATTPQNGAKKTDEAKPSYGISRAKSDNTNVPSFYVVPMKGQMGTDVRSSVYKDVISDIRAQKPDVLILEIHCSDTSELMFPQGYNTGSDEEDKEKQIREWGYPEFEDYRELVHMFRDELRNIPQYVWVKDSDGISATFAMAWDKIYMAPEARLGAKVSVLDAYGAKRWSDPDIRAKMMSAWLGIAQGFLERGGYSPDLAGAMLDSTPKLSGSWKGREVLWQLDESGEYLVDGSDKHTAYFTAETAEDFCVSAGTATDLNDLALLLGYREYRLIDGRQKALTTDYVAAWRKLYKQTQEWMRDFDTHTGWASGDETVKWLGRAKTDLENIVNAMDRYKAVELRWERDFGLTKLEIITKIEEMKEQLQALKRSGGGGAGGGRSRQGGGGGQGIGG